MRWISTPAAWLACAQVALPAFAAAATEGGPALSDYLNRLNEHGQSIIYSSDLVTGDMRLEAEPASGPTLSELQEILRPFGLTAIDGPAGSLLIVDLPRGEVADTGEPARLRETPIPEIVVTSSLHRIVYDDRTTHTYLDREEAGRIPKTADEAVRLTNRLPGTASGGISAQNHVRGGDANEVLFLFDGLRLYEPYHLKDFQAVATIINAAAIGGMDFYTGAYPAHFGDRMSGVLNVDLREPEAAIETELALSFFNASALSLGTFGSREQGDWLVSARRGNLDLIVDVIDPEFGSPDYHDYLAHVGWEFSPLAKLSGNYLVSDDKLRLNDTTRGERAKASYSNQIGWFKWQAQWTDRVQSDSILAMSDITNRRTGRLDLPSIVSGELAEEREFSAIEVQQDWHWLLSADRMLRFGFNIRNLQADYRFTSSQIIMPPFDAILDNQAATARDVELDPSGAQYGAYAELRLRTGEHWTVDVGVRWDQQNYTGADDDRQYSPRASVLYQPNDSTEVRFGWGQYYQAQEVNELQVSDGVTAFFPAQQAEHAVLNLRHAFPSGTEAAVSAYRKSFRRIRPRFENSFNSLTLLPELQFDRVEIAPSDADAIGVEISLRRGSAGDDLLWWLGYTWSEIEDDAPDGTVARSWDQTHTVKGGLAWRWRRWDFSAAGELHTGWPQTRMSGELVTQPGGAELLVLDVTERNAGRHAPFHALDLRVSRNFDVSRGDLTAFLEITNLYNRANPCCVEYSLALDGSLSSRTRHWLPLLPSLGVVWRF